jgi:hypothetical protein
MLRNLAISSFLFAGVVSAAHGADVFRWVDNQGGVHYSDQWVPGSELIKSASKPHPTSTSAPTSTQVPKPAGGPTVADASGQQSPAAQAMQQDKAKVREQQCKDAKERYEKAIQARHIFKTKQGPKDAEGVEQREYLSDEEADAYRVQVRQEMQDYCGSSAKGAE